jgi:glycosyltransferase involved in cell wall biosynthesis
MDLNFIGQFYGQMGIPNHTRDFAFSLAKKTNLSILPLQNGNKEELLSLKNNIKPLSVKNPTLMFWYPHMYEEMLGGFYKNIGYYIFEYTIIPKQYIDAINCLDSICTASKWGCDVLKKNGVNVPTWVVPGGVDSTKFNSKNCAREKKVFRFLHIGKYENRKGTEIMLRSFNEAFKGDESIRLTVMIDNPHIQNFSSMDYIKSLSLRYPIDNIDIIGYVDDISKIYCYHHCAVFPTKGEGIGLPIVEAMSSGLPVIVSNNSGVTEYANSDNSFLLTKLIKEPVYDKTFFPISGQFGEWFSPTIDELIVKMKYVYENYAFADKIGRQAEKWMKENYSWDIAAEKFLVNLNG